MILHYTRHLPRTPAPTELVSAERVILHYTRHLPRTPAPTELVSAERVILHYGATAASSGSWQPTVSGVTRSGDRATTGSAPSPLAAITLARDERSSRGA